MNTTLGPAALAVCLSRTGRQEQAGEGAVLIPGCRDTDKMLGSWSSSKHTRLEGLEVLQKVETGDVGTIEVSEAQAQCLQG